MKIFIAILALFAICVLPLRAAPADFVFTRPILGTTLDAPRLVEVRLDAALMAETQNQFYDLRLFDAANQEIPRSVEPLFTTQERVVRHTLDSTPVAIQELPDNRIEARFDLPSNQPSAYGLTIRTPLKDFIRTVRVSGSDDGQTWIPLVEDAEIFDYTRYMDIRRTEIALPANSYRHFAVEIGNASEERAQPLIRLVQANGQDQSRAYDLLQTPFRIDGVTFWRDVTTFDKDKPVLQEWPPAGFVVTQDAKAKTTEIVIQAGKAPVTRLVLETPARNFQRTATIYAPALAAGQKTWRTLGEGQFTRVDLPGFATNDLAIDFPEQRAAELRLVLANNDNPPIEISAIRAYGPTYRLLWLADPAAAYRLFYGDDRAVRPDYDLYPIRTALSKGLAPDLWTLGEPVPNNPVQKHFSLGDFLARPAVFGSLLALAALALLLLLAKALKKAA